MNKKHYFTSAFISALLAIYANTFILWLIVLLITYIGLGGLLAFIIDILTAGYGKDIAGWIAYKLGYTSCGCDERKALLDKYTKIKLIEEIKL